MKRYISSALWAALLCLCLAFTGGAVYAQDGGPTSLSPDKERLFREEIDRLKRDTAKLGKENRDLNEKLKSGNTSSEVNALKAKITQLESEIKNLSKRPTKEKVDELIKKAKGELEGKVATLETENRNLKNTLSAKQGDAATQVDVNNEKADLQKQLDAANKEIEKLEKENAALQEQNKANQMPPFATIVLVGALIVCLVLLFLQVGRVKQLQKRLAVAPTGTPRDAAHKNLDTELRVIIQQIEASEKRVLEALQQSENLSQIALTNFANDLRQQIRTEEPRVTTKASKKEESQPDHTQQTLYQYFLYAESVSAKGIFSQVNTAKGKEKMFVLELQNADDRKALYDLNRESPNYATWLSDRGQYLEHSCAIESGAPLAPKRCTTVEKGVAVLEGGEWHVVRPLSLRLS